MTRYAALLRGVSPLNARMPELKKAFEAAGFHDVRTLLSSGNVVFDAPKAPEREIERAAEASMLKRLGRSFLPFVRSVDALQALLDGDPYKAFRLKAESKRVITFLAGSPKTKPALPIELHGARILALMGREVFSAYLPGPRGPVFMTLLEKTFGKDITTRTWDTVAKVVRA